MYMNEESAGLLTARAASGLVVSQACAVLTAWRPSGGGSLQQLEAEDGQRMWRIPLY